MSWTDVVLAQAAGVADDVSRPWFVHRGRALPVADLARGERLARIGSIDELVSEWYAFAPYLRATTEDPRVRTAIESAGVAVADLDVRAPVAPHQVFCTIGNYARQVVEAALDAGDGPDGVDAPARRADAIAMLDERRRDGEPYICLTSPQRVAPPHGRLTVPTDLDKLDWEVELAAVIGSGPRDGSGAAPETVVAGYCLANDLTIRSAVFRDDVPLGSDWIRSKGLPGSLPLGPWFVPAWQLPDLTGLRLQLYVDDRLMQDDVAGDMVFDVERQVDYLRRHTALAPGDVICTGSPAGFGAHYRRFLRAGDVVRARADELGEQRLACITAPALDADLVPVPASAGRPDDTEDRQ